jgi:hypothetical protein
MGTTNFDDLQCDNMMAGESQELTGNGAITIKCGMCTLNKGSAIAATLAAPTATTDDYKRLMIASLTAQQHTVTCENGFGNGLPSCSEEEDVATFSGVIGDALTLVAYQGAWYVVGKHQITLA